MTDNEIIREFEEALRKSYDTIAKQKAEIEKKDTEIEILIRKKEALRDEISELTAEIERLKDHVVDLNKKVKHEAYREFAKKLKAKKFTHKNLGELVYIEDIDNTLKELTDQTATNHSVSLIDGHIEE